MSGPTGAANPVTATGANVLTGRQSWQSGTTVKANIQPGAYTILTTDYLIVFTGTGGYNVTLPGAPGAGDQYVLKNRTAGLLTVIGTVDGAVNPTVAAGASLYLFWSGTEWINGT